MADHIQIGDVSPRIQYVANGTQVQFTYPFPIFVAADMEVYLGEAEQGSGFTIAGAGSSAGGSVTFAAAPASNTVVTLRRRIAIRRTSDFQESGEFRAKVINDELDYQTAALQQIADDGTRSLHLAATDTGANLTLPAKAARASKYLGFDTSGDPIAASGTGTTPPISTFAETLLDDADAPAARATLGLVIGTNVLAPNGDGSDLTNLPLDAALAADIRLLALETAALKGDRLNMANGWADPLKDETDIETGSNVNATYVSAGGGYYHNPGGYGANLCTVSGNASVSTGINPGAATDGNQGTYWNAATVSAPQWWKYDFGAGNDKTIQRFRVAGDGTSAFTASGALEYSDNDSSWTQATTWSVTSLTGYSAYFDFASVGAHRYWRITITSWSAGGVNIYLSEAQMHEAVAPVNMTVVSKQVVAATSAPTVGRLHVQIKDITGGSAVNTDFKGYVSRDDGATYTQGTLALVQTLADGTKAYEFDNLSISAQPSGTAPRFKFTTHNIKEIQLHGAVVQWK